MIIYLLLLIKQFQIIKREVSLISSKIVNNVTKAARMNTQ